MKSNQPRRFHVETRLTARFFTKAHSFGKAAVLVMAAVLLLELSAPAATVVWDYGGIDRNWSTAGNWTGGIPEATNAVIFNNTDAQTGNTPVNTVDASTTVSSLSYTNSSLQPTISYQNTTVASGRTLTITNGLAVGAGTVGGATTNLNTTVNMTGVGAKVAVTGGNVQIGHQSLSSGATYYIQALLDMRGLDEFSYNNAAGTFSVAGNAQRRQGGEVYLATTNDLTAANITVGYTASGFGSRPGLLHLGTTNTLLVNTITVGQRQTGCLMDFQTGLTAPGVKIRAQDGINGVANWYLGWHNSPNQNGNNSAGTNDFSGGLLDASVTNLYVGYISGVAPTGTRTADGTFIMGTNPNNALVVQNLYLGLNAAASGTVGNLSSANGNWVVGGGTVTATAVTLAQAGSYLATGTLTVSNGASLSISGDLVDGGGASTISLSQGTLTVGGRVGDSPSINNVETLNLDTATLGLTLVASGDYTNAAAFVDTLNVSGAAGSTLIKINNTIPPPAGQYPLIGYYSLNGFDGLSIQAPAGYTATLSNNVTTYPSTVDVILSPAQALAFTTAAFTKTAGVLSDNITLQLQTGGGTPINATSNLTVNLATTSAGGVFRDVGDTTTINSITILTGNSSASFKYRDTVAGTPTLTATKAGAASAFQDETIVAGAAAKLGFTPEPATGFVNVTLSPVVVQVQDAYGNPVPQGSTSVTLTLNGGTLASGTTVQNTDVNGQATFSDLLIMVPGTGLNFTASAAGPLTGTSSNFNVTYRQIVKAKNTDNMDLTTSWITGVVPGQYDVAVINDASVSAASANAHADLGVSTTWYGLLASNWTAGTGYRFDNISGSTLTLGAGGIVGADVNHSLNLSNNFLLSVAQTCNWGDANSTGGTLNFFGNVNNNGNDLTLSGQRPINFDGVLSGSGRLVIANRGTNTITLSGDNTYAGGTTVGSGTVLVDNATGSGTGTGAVVVNSGGTLGGTGSIAGVVTNNSGGTLAPGTAVGTLTLSGSLALNAGSTNTFEVDGTTPTNDVVIVGGTVTYGGLLQIVPTGTFTIGQSFVLFSGPGVVNAGNFGGIQGSPGAGLAFAFTNGVLSVVTAGPSGPGTITNSVSGNTLTLTWPANESWRLVGQTNNLSTGLNPSPSAWFTVPGGVDGSNSITIDRGNPSVFYRLVSP